MAFVLGFLQMGKKPKCAASVLYKDFSFSS
jgi:hypothetical protein